jgi:hypothetical protein
VLLRASLAIPTLMLFSLWAWAEPPRAELRFAFVGCNRIGFNELSSDNPSSANRQQLLQTCRDLAADPPAYLFLVGDIVTNYGEGSATLRGQLEPWVELYRGTELADSPTVMVPMVGNHEVLSSRQNPETGLWKDYPNPATLPVWEELMAPYLRWSDGPTTEGPNHDGLTHDQSRLTFTVRHGGVLFLCLNTDTFIDDTTIGDVPLHWIEEQLARASADPGVDHVFVLGHKPVLRPDLPGDIIRAGEEEALDRMLADCPKLRAYLTAHYHLWDCRRTRQGVLQVIAGNGGTAPSGQFNADGRGYFGYTVVELLSDGSMSLESWGRPIPEPYHSEHPQPPATLRQRIHFPNHTRGD